MKKLLFLAVIIFFCGNSFAQDYGKFATKEQRMEWFQDARFGMFIHWGPVALKGTEIGHSRGMEAPVEEYDSLYTWFYPVLFDAEEWVKTAKDAGMKYIVLTTKHHDGFCLWDTEYTDYNITNSQFGRDVLKELSEACKKHGIALGTYYSTCDWYHPDFPLTSPKGRVFRESSNLDRYTEYLKNQSAELINNYGPLLVLWYDVPQEFDSIRGQRVIDYIEQIQPDILVNDRSGAPGDFDTPEQKIGSYQDHRPWETCMTIARQWAWKPNDEIKSPQQCLQSLIRSAGGNGNLLLNVGPMLDGRIEPLQVARLKQMGDWLEKYGFSIYGTRGGPFKPTDWGVSTRKGNKIFLHVLNWFGDNPAIELPAFGQEIISCSLLNGEKVKLQKVNGNYVIEIPKEAITGINTIVELEVSGDAMEIEAIEAIPQSVSYGKPIKASSRAATFWREVEAVNNGDWAGRFWEAGKEDKEPWVEIDLQQTVNISNAVIFESGKNILVFKIQYKKGGEWKTSYTGTTVGEGKQVSFPEFSTQKVRLVMTEFDEPPGLYEIVLF